MGAVLRATYQERIEQAIKISKRENKSPGDLIVDVMAAIGHDFGDAEIVNRQWASYYAERDTTAADAERLRLDLVNQLDDLSYGERF